MADIFEEVEEGIRQDRLETLWKRYGVFAYMAAALLIGGVALNEYLKVASAQSTERGALAIEAAAADLAEQNYEQAATALTAIVEEEAGPSEVAAQLLAQVRLEGNGDAATATQVLSEAGVEATLPTEKLALIKAAYLQADTLTRAELETFLGDLPKEQSAFGIMGLELLAAKALQEGDIEYARTEYGLIRVSSNVPPGVEERARRALATLPPPEIADPLLVGSEVGATEETEGVVTQPTDEGTSE